MTEYTTHRQQPMLLVNEKGALVPPLFTATLSLVKRIRTSNKNSSKIYKLQVRYAKAGLQFIAAKHCNEFCLTHTNASLILRTSLQMQEMRFLITDNGLGKEIY